MTDQIARSQQYEYRQNSNLVLSVDYNLTDRRARDEPTGEVMPLTKDLLRGSKMGDKYRRTAVPAEKKASKGKSRDREDIREQKTAVDEVGIAGIYKPRTQETRNTFEVFLSLIQEIIGDQPREILHGASHEILLILKSDSIREKEKKKEAEDLFSTKLTEERFALLTNLAKKITDFNPDDEDEKRDIVTIYEGTLRTAEGSGGGKADGIGEKKQLNPRDIDAHWVKRYLSKHFDPNESQQKTQEVLNILKNSVDDRACENSLVLLLGFTHFDFIKQLCQNRHMIYYCTRLKQTQGEERESIENEMASKPELKNILDELIEVREDDIVATERGKRDKAAQQRRMNEAAQEAVAAASWTQQRKVYDLEDMA
uniref:Brr2 N-terminal helicase PWI domain-containing protein n=2 Tax=Meloidogyne javanica TaxID=6303 RepID=A0A915LVN9_MELJA